MRFGGQLAHGKIWKRSPKSKSFTYFLVCYISCNLLSFILQHVFSMVLKTRLDRPITVPFGPVNWTGKWSDWKLGKLNWWSNRWIGWTKRFPLNRQVQPFFFPLLSYLLRPLWNTSFHPRWKSSSLFFLSLSSFLPIFF